MNNRPTRLLVLAIMCQVMVAVQPYYIPLEPQPRIVWEVPTEDVVVKRLQDSSTGQFILRMWPSSLSWRVGRPPKSSKPFEKHYLPYHPVPRFRGANRGNIRAMFSAPVEIKQLSYRKNSRSLFTAPELLGLMKNQRFIVTRKHESRIGIRR